MFFIKPKRASFLLHLLSPLLLISSTSFFSLSHGAFQFHNPPSLQLQGMIAGSEYGDLPWRVRRSFLEENDVKLLENNSSLILAANRTHRKDPLDHFKYYKGGWNISEKHYFSSVGFTAAPLFLIAAIWFLGFGLSLLINVGSIVLYIGQEKFHNSTKNTLKYVVNQADATVNELRTASNCLSAAKTTGVDQIFLPPSVQHNIDRVDKKINGSATTLEKETHDNSDKIRKALDAVVMADTCVAMDQWVQNPTAHTALDDILPCVDTATAQETLSQSKDVTSKLVGVVNFFISNVANKNIPPTVGPPNYYNQSGPLVPILCNPFNSDRTDRNCSDGEVNFSNAAQEWGKYICEVSENVVCTTVGRLTPAFYDQMVAIVNVSYALYRHVPPLVEVADCTFVRVTFGGITEHYCPDLRLYSKWIVIGLVIVSAAVMLSLIFIFWVFYARKRQHETDTGQSMHTTSPQDPSGKEK
ncbi:Plasma membrane fusion protein [Citrus sinensis]|uniref:Plasma membrane fusion protein n=1 Tax=Citrus sinensis TaxID=2711 RepID=A0ACB8JD40_CITSI|nr:Plasma membrane fusion protein [Citrus sinensis]